MNLTASTRTLGPAVVVGLLAFALTVAWRAQSTASVQRDERRVEIARVVAARQRTTAQLELRLGDLRTRLDQAIAVGDGEALRELRDLSEQLARLSGASPVDGPGVVVELTDAAEARAADRSDTSFRIQDVDIQAVVNALWAAGAEAIAVNGQRLVSTSAARNAGGAVLVNYRVLTSPYRIEAIGDAGTLEERFGSSEIAADFRGWAQTFGLGYAVRRAGDLHLAAFAGSLRFRYASTVDQGS